MTKDDADPIIRNRLWIVLAITVIGAVMRFAFLTRPALWGDEAFTYSRVCGDFREMLDVLQFDGFPPLHYEAYWVLGRATTLTPRTMRAIPAVAGTLLIPAMYFLAAQIVRRRTALLAALFTCVSAYLMVYSRDAKMYACAWLFITLHVACLLWWLRSGLRVAWLAWIAAGLAAVGMHVTALAIIAVEPLMLLALLVGRGRPGWRHWAAFLIGIVVIGAGVAGWKAGFNRWSEHVDDLGFTLGSGVGWVEEYNNTRNGAELPLYAATAHLYSWEWPRARTLEAQPGIHPDVIHAGMAASVLVLLLLAAGAMPFRRRGEDGDWKIDDRSAPPSISSPRTQSSVLSPQSLPPGWRQLLWLSLWIVLPAYGVYCYSVREFASPIDWLRTAGDLFNQHWILVACAMIALALVCHVIPLLARYLAAAIPAAALLLLIGLLYNAGLTRLTNRPTWHAAYWPVLSRWGAIAGDARVLIALAIVLPVLAWQMSACTVAQRTRKAAQFAAVPAVLFACCLGVHAYVLHRHHALARQTTVDHRDAPQWEGYVRQALRDHGVPSREAALKAVQFETPVLPKPAMERRADANVRSRQFRWDALVATAMAKGQPAVTLEQAERAAAEQLASERVIWEKWVSIWMPRYLGFCWPAVAIAVCALLLRLPTRPLRWGAVMLLLALNLLQVTARIFADSEPPMDKIIADVMAGQSSGRAESGVTRTFMQQMSPFYIGHPGTLSVFGHQARYYVSLSTTRPVHPEEFRRFSGPRSGEPWEPWGIKINFDQSPDAILEDLRRTHASRAIFWERLDLNARKTVDQQVATKLGPGWQLVHDNTYACRSHWNWQTWYLIQRREYVHAPEI